jgi:hypothetical protein
MSDFTTKFHAKFQLVQPVPLQRIETWTKQKFQHNLACTCGYVGLTQNGNLFWTQAKLILSQIAAKMMGSLINKALRHEGL